jgi:hypothetical protein
LAKSQRSFELTEVIQSAFEGAEWLMTKICSKLKKNDSIFGSGNVFLIMCHLEAHRWGYFREEGIHEQDIISGLFRWHFPGENRPKLLPAGNVAFPFQNALELCHNCGQKNPSLDLFGWPNAGSPRKVPSVERSALH